MVSAIVAFPPLRFVARGLIGLANLLVGPRGRHTGVERVRSSSPWPTWPLEEDVIEREERALIHSIIEFGDTVVREVMVPRPDMRTVETDLTVSQALGVALAAGYSRLPAYDENVDDILGIAYAKDLIRAERAGRGGDPVRDHVRPAHFVPETKRVADLMREMQDRKFHQAIVVDEYGGTAGLVTLEDLIEELVGEIVDEYDVEESPVEPLGDGEYSVSARLAARRARRAHRRRAARGQLGHGGRPADQPARPRPRRGGVGRRRRRAPGGRARDRQPGRARAHRPHRPGRGCVG